MDAVEFLKKLKRMCDENRDINEGSCYGCEIFAKKVYIGISCSSFTEQYPEEAVAIIEKWSAEHPAKTRQSEFLKVLPFAPTDENGVPITMPCHVDYRASKRCNSYTDCGACKKEYWAAEVE